MALWAVPYTPLRVWPGLSSLVAIDAIVSIAALIAAGVLVLAGRGQNRHLLVICLASTIICVLFGGRWLAQGVSAGAPPAGDGTRFVSWNAGDVDPGSVAEELAPIIHEIGAQVIVLPETGWRSGEIVGEALDGAGIATVVIAPESSTTSILMSAQLAEAGHYEVDESGPPWAGTVARPAHPSAQYPVIVGVHIQQPALASTDTWALHLSWVRSLCETEPYIAIIGDFNSTLNSLGGTSLGNCADVGSAHAAGSAATWPTTLPPFLGVAIDRFFVGDAYDPGSAAFQILRSVQGSDHWAITGEIPTTT